MTDPRMGGPRPKSSRNLIKPRQLTIGECAAIAHYGRVLCEEYEGGVPLNELLAFLDRQAVCTTCGWSERLHLAEEDSPDWGITCRHYTRKL
jgi:hypothetical protein